MKPIDATRLQLKAMELVEGTGLEWNICLRNKISHAHTSLNLYLYDSNDLELALGIIEGKPVWEGDTLWYTPGIGSPLTIKIDGGHNLKLSGWSWLPPAPKTAMVEFLVEDIKHWSKYNAEWHEQSNRLYEACRKTLEGLK